MQLNELRERITYEFEYPVTVKEVIKEMGGTQIDAIYVEDRKTVGELLDHLEDVTFATPQEVSESIYGHLTDEYVGRKYYDDRGPNQAIKSNEPTDLVNQSI